jgi:hypothetical protein
VEAAVRAALVVVVSAGNIGVNPQTGLVGFGGITSPGNAPSAITVGAMKTNDTARRDDDRVADYSSRGPTWYDAYAKPDLMAPGHRLLAAATAEQYLYSTYPTLQGPTYGARRYLRLSGTSMATGVVSGTVALMIEAARAQFGAAPTPNAIKAMLMTSALPMRDASGTPYHVLEQGAGSLNAAGALTLATAINPTLPMGSSWLVTGVTESTTVDGHNIVWGDNIAWGDLTVGSICEVLKATLNAGRRPRMSFFRDHQGHEVDLIVERGDGLMVVEIKSGQTVAAEFFDDLVWLAGQDLGPRPVPLTAILVYGGGQRQPRTQATVLPWTAVHEVDW